MSGLLKVDKNNFQAEVLEASETVVVDIWAPGCGPCERIAPWLDEISTEMAGKVKIAKLNVVENPEIAAQFDVQGVPTLIRFEGGKVADIQVGVPMKMSKTELSHWIAGNVA